jgi:hypothetical protein
MSMIGHVRQITPEQLKEMQGNPSLVVERLKSKGLPNLDEMVAALHRIQKIGLAGNGLISPDAFIDRERDRAQILAELQSVGVRLPGEDPGEEGLSLEKSWHTLHYLLTGKPEEAPPPLGNAILGGVPIGDDVGYGPARFLTPEQVREVASALSAFTMDDLADRFDAGAMSAANVYGAEGEEPEWAQYYFASLVRYYNDAAEKGNAMLLYID